MASSDYGPALLIVLAPEAALPPGEPTLADLEAVQGLAPQLGFSLRLFSAGAAGHRDLATLPWDGGLTGTERRTADGCQLLCDAVIPDFHQPDTWLGVYLQAGAPGTYRCADRLPLAEVTNETCWFYPTNDGLYLSWIRHLALRLAPGRLADGPAAPGPVPYQRQHLRVLWSLLADQRQLTCVGFAYGGQRIDWPLLSVEPAAEAIWSHVLVASASADSLVVQDSQTVRAPG